MPIHRLLQHAADEEHGGRGARERALVDFTMQTELHDVVATDDHAMSLVRVSIDFDGRHLDFDEAHVWHVSDDFAIEMWAVPKDPYEVDAFFAGR